MRLVNSFRAGALAWAVAAILLGLAGAPAALAGPPTGRPIDEAFRQKYVGCDRTDTFDGVRFPIKKAGKTIWYGCSSDPSRFERFEAIAAAGSSPAAVVIESKLGRDEDGSSPPCHHAGGPTDQCGTTLMLYPTPAHPCLVKVSPGEACVPLDADTVAYVVMPGAAPKGIDARQFARLSRLQVGDYGVVLFGTRAVPVVVGDVGPAYKIGEGSTALLKALAADGRPHTISSGVVFVLFPGSLDQVRSLSPDTIAETAARQGNLYYGRLAKPH